VMGFMSSSGGHVTGDTYIFIDGGHLRRYHAEAVTPWFGYPAELDLGVLRGGSGAQKCFYYDCLNDRQQNGESDQDYQQRVQRQKDLFRKFQRTPMTHVRLGALTGKGKNIRQKQVDILLAVDMMNHAVRGNMRRAVLFTGDQDFIPVVESLVDLGLLVQVRGDRRHTSMELADAADEFHPLSFYDYYEWSDAKAKEQNPLPGRGTGLCQPPSWRRTERHGTVEGAPAELYTDGSRWAVQLHTASGDEIVYDADPDRALLFCRACYGGKFPRTRAETPFSPAFLKVTRKHWHSAADVYRMRKTRGFSCFSAGLPSLFGTVRSLVRIQLPRSQRGRSSGTMNVPFSFQRPLASGPKVVK
jgi:NYN domain